MRERTICIITISTVFKTYTRDTSPGTAHVLLSVSLFTRRRFTEVRSPSVAAQHCDPDFFAPQFERGRDRHHRVLVLAPAGGTRQNITQVSCSCPRVFRRQTFVVSVPLWGSIPCDSMIDPTLVFPLPIPRAIFSRRANKIDGLGHPTRRRTNPTQRGQTPNSLKLTNKQRANG